MISCHPTACLLCFDFKIILSLLLPLLLLYGGMLLLNILPSVILRKFAHCKGNILIFFAQVVGSFDKFLFRWIRTSQFSGFCTTLGIYVLINECVYISLSKALLLCEVKAFFMANHWFHIFFGSKLPKMWSTSMKYSLWVSPSFSSF